MVGTPNADIPFSLTAVYVKGQAGISIEGGETQTSSQFGSVGT